MAVECGAFLGRLKLLPVRWRRCGYFQPRLDHGMPGDGVREIKHQILMTRM